MRRGDRGQPSNENCPQRKSWTRGLPCHGVQAGSAQSLLSRALTSVPTKRHPPTSWVAPQSLAWIEGLSDSCHGRRHTTVGSYSYRCLKGAEFTRQHLLSGVWASLQMKCSQEKGHVMINFISTWLGHVMPGYLVKCYSRCVLRVFLDEINIWMSGLSKVALPSVGGWPSFSQWKARMPSTKRGTLHPKKGDSFCLTALSWNVRPIWPLELNWNILSYQAWAYLLLD